VDSRNENNPPQFQMAADRVGLAGLSVIRCFWNRWWRNRR